MKLHFLAVTLLGFVPATLSADEVATVAKLSAAELQEILEIQAYRVAVPESFGGRPLLLVEHYINGKRTSLEESSLIFSGKERNVLITWRDEGMDRMVLTKSIVNSTRSTSRCANKPDKLKYDFSDTLSGAEVSEYQIILKRTKYYVQDGKDAGGFVIKKEVGQHIIRIAKNTDPLPESK